MRIWEIMIDTKLGCFKSCFLGANYLARSTISEPTLGLGKSDESHDADGIACTSLVVFIVNVKSLPMVIILPYLGGYL